jgi:hypothetical protein
LNDQRLLPRLSSLLLSYCPERRGNLKADTNNEILPVVRKVLHRHCRGPDQIDETRNRGSPMPAISRSRGWPSTRPRAAKEDAGTITSNLADWPAKSKDRT